MSKNMGVSEALRDRRSIRWFDPEWRMSDEDFSRMINHVVLSPTALNIQNWRFLRVTDKARRSDIRKVAWDQGHGCIGVGHTLL